MRLALVFLSLALAVHAAEAGPCVAPGRACLSYAYPALADETVLPRGPWIAVNVRDMVVSGTQDKDSADPQPVAATIDGKRVPIAVKDVHSRGGIIRLVHIKSRRVGTLAILGKLWKYSRGIDGIGTYRIAADAKKVTTPTLTIEKASDPIHRRNSAALEIDANAIAFTLTWRRDDKDTWHTEILDAQADSDGHTTTFVDDGLCGDGCLAAGIDATLTAMLTDGRTVEIAVPAPLVMPEK